MANIVLFQRVVSGFICVSGLLTCLFLSGCTRDHSLQHSVSNYEAEQIAAEAKVHSSYVHPECQTSDGPGAYRFGVDDEIEVNIFDEKELSGQYRVNAQGTIDMPLIGEVVLMGCTSRQAGNILTALYKDGYLVDPSISIQVSKYRPFFILGEVRTPGQYDYSSGLTVMKAAALAGGFTYRADQRSVVVLRKNENLSAVSEALALDGQIHPGDVVTVRERFF